MRAESLIYDEELVFTDWFVLNIGPLVLLAEDVPSLGEDFVSVSFSDLSGDGGLFFSKEVLLVVTAHLRIINELKAGESIWECWRRVGIGGKGGLK